MSDIKPNLVHWKVARKAEQRVKDEGKRMIRRLKEHMRK